MTGPDKAEANQTPDFFALKYQIAIEEWKLASSNIGRLDSLVFTVRGWAIALATAAIGYAYSKQDPRVCILILLPLLTIWFIDALFKNFQRVFISRSKEIEEYLSSPVFSQDFEARTMSGLTTPLLSSRFGAGSFGDRIGAVLRHMFLRNVLAIYIPLVILSLISYALISIFNAS